MKMMSNLILLVGLVLSGTQSWAQGSIEKEWTKKTLSDWDAWQNQKEKERISKARSEAELATGARIIKLQYDRYGWNYIAGTGSTENKVWMKMSNGQICYVYIWDGHEVSKAHCR